MNPPTPFSHPPYMLQKDPWIPPSPSTCTLPSSSSSPSYAQGPPTFLPPSTHLLFQDHPTKPLKPLHPSWFTTPPFPSTPTLPPNPPPPTSLHPSAPFSIHEALAQPTTNDALMAALRVMERNRRRSGRDAVVLGVRQGGVAGRCAVRHGMTLGRGAGSGRDMTMYWKRKDVTAKMETAGLKDGDVITPDSPTHRYTILHQLGKGGCGDVYLAQTLSPHHPPTLVAIKTIKDLPQYHNELHVLRLLNHHKLGRGFTPQLLDTVEQRRVIVMEYLGETLAMKFEQLGYCFSLKTIAMIAINMLHLSHDFYLKTGHVHVDLKPSNICVGPTGRELHVIDFGYATLPSVKLPGQTGTPLFMAVQVQSLGAVYPSWLDDLESIAYCLMFFIGHGKPGLPWGHLHTHAQISQTKSPPHIHHFLHTLHHTPHLHPLATPLTRLLDVARNRQRTVGEREFEKVVDGFVEVVRELGGNDGMYDWV